MNRIVGFMVWVDGEATKAISDSFEMAKTLAFQCVTGSNRVEITTTDGPAATWHYDNDTKEFVRVL